MSQEPFGDIPLFRELQRLLSGSEGPLNLEIARQVAAALAAQGATDRNASGDEMRSYAEAVRNAELLMSGYTRLEVDEPARSEVINRNRWASHTIDSWRWLFEALALRFGRAFGDETQREIEAAGQQAILQQVVPLLMGLQVGTLLGHMSQEALGRYDLPVPHHDDGRLFLVIGNAEKITEEYGFNPSEFHSWVALREAAYHLVVSSRPWVPRYLSNALLELVDSIEIDLADVERRLMDLQTKGMEALQGLRSDDVLPVVQTDRHRGALARLQSFVTLLEGYAAHATSEVGEEVIPSVARIEEGMIRRAASPSEGKAALTHLLGLSLDRTRATAGSTFCAAVVKLKGLGALNRVWAAADNLPTAEEIRDPFQWIERVIEEQ
jgi:putative hydrolase